MQSGILGANCSNYTTALFVRIVRVVFIHRGVVRPSLEQVIPAFEPGIAFGPLLGGYLHLGDGKGALVFGFDLTSPGSKQTLNYAAEIGRPYFKFEYPIGRDADSKEMRLIEEVVSFILKHRPVVVNVAGNRDTDANNSNFTTTRRVFGLILDLVKERLAELE